jgi:N-acetylmuramoyl-L-alanine amidase
MSFATDTDLARPLPSPNHGERRDGRKPDCLILHYTGMATAQAALARLSDPTAEVSAHYVVLEDGGIIQMVNEERRAWHAGAGLWQGESDLNSASIGIEIVNYGHDGNLPAFPEAQINSTIALCRDILARHKIVAHRVLAHSDIAPARKRDPGEHFPWDKLHAAGVGHYVKPSMISGGRFLARGEQGQPVEALQAMLALYGYGIEVTGFYDIATEQVVAAFQRHFRQERVDGVADASTITTLRDLIAALPITRG